ncbi:MAG: hypothetical protein HYX96_05050 [Chloroflexi bacterium]|nr:hypothetical protein [Chloroflexota bacterium]
MGVLRCRKVRRWIIPVAMGLSLLAWQPGGARALSVAEYFTLSYAVQLDKTAVRLNEPFSATLTGTIAVKQDLPFNVSQARITSRVIASHTASGAQVVLDPGYNVAITPFPSKAGETAQATDVIPLLFPASSAPGQYYLTGELTEALVIVAGAWLPVTDYMPPVQPMGSVELVDGDDAGAGRGGQSGGNTGNSQVTLTPTPTTTPGIHDLSVLVDHQGRFKQKYTGKSSDGKVAVTVKAGTRAVKKDGLPLSHISAQKFTSPKPAPEHMKIVDLYEFGPDGVTFDPAVSVTFSYDYRELPPGFDENKLAVMTVDVNGEWTRLEDFIVDPAARTVTAALTHFSVYAVVAPARPAAFKMSDIALAPERADVGQDVSLGSTITNTGDLAGVYTLTLRVNGEIEQSKIVTLDGGESQGVLFTISRPAAGAYQADINGISRSFTVGTPAELAVEHLEIGSPEIEAGQPVTVTARVTNKGDLPGDFTAVLTLNGVVTETRELNIGPRTSAQVVFIVAASVPGSYEVGVGGVSGRLMVIAEEEDPPSNESRPSFIEAEPYIPQKINLWLVLGILVLQIGLAVGIYLILRRPRTKKRDEYPGNH